MSRYNYKNCQSLFGYAADVHIRCECTCQLCGCGGNPLDFDLWRQMTVEHLIGKSQGGYLNQIRKEVTNKFPFLLISEVEELAKKIDAINTVTACQFCNSTTSRDISEVSMYDLISTSESTPADVIENVAQACAVILKEKQESVKWKIESVKAAFYKYVAPKIV